MLRRVSQATSPLHVLSCWRQSPVIMCAQASSMRHKSFRMKIGNRASFEQFSARRYVAPTRLDVAAPRIAAEWDFEKNPGHVFPKIVGVASLSKFWWRCSDCNHSYEDSVERRCLRGKGCPACALRSPTQVVEEVLTSLQQERQATEEMVDSKPLKSVKSKKRSTKKKLLRKGKSKKGLKTKSALVDEQGVSDSTEHVPVARPPAPPLLPGESDVTMRPKRLPVFTQRTKY